MAAVSCPQCFYEFNVPAKYAGKKVRCPECSKPVAVPARSGGASAPPMPRSAPQASRSTSSTSRKRKKQSSDNTPLIVGGAVAAVVVVGLVAFLMGRSSAPIVAENAAAAAPAQATVPEAASTASGIDVAASTPAADVASISAVTTSQAATSPATGTLPADLSPPTGTSTPTGTMPQAGAAQTGAPQTGMPGLTGQTVVAKAQGSAADASPDAADAAIVERPTQPMEMIDLVEYVERSVVRIIVKGEYGSSLGSGFVVGTDGTIVTNYHVIEGAKSAEAAFRDGTKAQVTGVRNIDHTRDIAVLKIDAPSDKLHPLHVAGELPRKGEKVAAFGAPQGLEFSASAGIISGFRKPSEIGIGYTSGQWLQTTAPISSGNSGGPLVNMLGEVVGMNSAVRTSGQNLNFSVSCLDIREMTEQAGDKVADLSPESVPVKISGEFGNAQHLAGTQRGNILLSQISEAVVLIAPLNVDPTGRIADFVMTVAEQNIVERTGWKRVTRASQMKGSTAIVFVALYFNFADGIPLADLVSQMNVHFMIVARDVDSEGNELLAIVWDEKAEVGTVAVKALMQGIVPRNMKDNVSGFFKKFVTAYRRAVREVDG
jgi:S1-C subfamily serine protease